MNFGGMAPYTTSRSSLRGVPVALMDRKLTLGRDYFWMTPQAMRAPELPEGSVM